MQAAAGDGSAARVGRRRWLVCALLFFATTVNYMDRQVLGILKPTLQHDLGWSEIDYANIVFAFQFAYAIGLALVGRLMDRLGTRRGFALAVVWWSLAAMAHALVRTPLGFSVARFALGLGEAGNFPAAIRTVAEWFPRKERALATGLFNAGSNLGSLITPLAVPFIVLAFGWPAAFVAIGCVDLVWLASWLALYRTPEQSRSLSAKELAYIRSDPPQPAVRVPWSELLRHRQTWAFALGKLITDPVWWLYLFWLPDFFSRRFDLDLKGLSLPLVVVFLAADIGSVGGGWLSSRLIARGWSVNRGRKTAMLVCALAATPVMFAAQVTQLWQAIALIALAAAAHQGWSANLFTTTSDLFPCESVSSVAGFGGMFGAVGGMVIAQVVGYLLQATGSYVPVFVLASSAYLAALGVIQLLAPRMQPARLGREA